MLAMLVVAFLTVISTVALAAEPSSFAFKPDGFHKAFNDSALARKTGRSVRAGKCEKGPAVVCHYVMQLETMGCLSVTMAEPGAALEAARTSRFDIGFVDVHIAISFGQEPSL